MEGTGDGVCVEGHGVKEGVGAQVGEGSHGLQVPDSEQRGQFGQVPTSSAHTGQMGQLEHVLSLSSEDDGTELVGGKEDVIVLVPLPF